MKRFGINRRRLPFCRDSTHPRDHPPARNFFPRLQMIWEPVRDETDQARYVAERILEHRESAVPLKQQAVLFRASHHSAPLEIELARRNIPFVKFGGLKFLEAAHVKDVLAFL